MSNDKIQFNIKDIDDDVPPPLAESLPSETEQEAAIASFNKALTEFINSRNIKVNILTPTYGGQCNVSYTHSLINTVNLFNEFGIKLKIDFCRNDSLVSRARNNLVARAMTDPSVTHIMFIDSDIAWNPLDILVFVLSDRDIIGGAYPIKKYHWERLLEEDNIVKKWLEHKNTTSMKGYTSDISYIQQRLLRYNINVNDPRINVNDNLMEVRHVATGFMMFKREVIEKMQKVCQHLKYKDPTGFLNENETQHAYALFEPSIKDGVYFSEDWTFCERWTREMEGKIYINIAILLTHVGSEDYTGSLAGLI